MAKSDGRRPYVPRIHNPEDMVEVPHPDDMDDETFLKHLEHRHAAECLFETTPVARRAMGAWMSTYRAFHARLHKIAGPGQHDHEHEDMY